MPPGRLRTVDSYLSLTTVHAGGSTPVLFGSNPMGDALLSTGLMSLAGANAAAMVPLLPVRISGIDVRETLHRFVAAANAPTPERGVTTRNQAGEALGSITMRWLAAPDLFEATPSTPPPDTELDPSRSQRFVMHDAVLRFDDRTRSGMRFFGAGRTYPLVVDGVRRLLFAGAAVVVEGLGVLKGVRGSVSVAGEISGRSIGALHLVARFDGDGPLETAERLGPLVEAANGRDASILMLFGEAEAAPAGVLTERLSSVVIDNDVANATHPRCGCWIGEAIGVASGPLRFDPDDYRCAVRLIDGRRELTFTDPDGERIGAIVADDLEGTAFHDDRAGDAGSRVIGYGVLSAGSGSLSGAAGVLTLDAAIDRHGRSATTYTLWLSDRRGHFRTASSGLGADAPGAAPPVAAELQTVDDGVDPLLPADRLVVRDVDALISQVAGLRELFAQKEQRADYGERFEILRDQSSRDEAFGFFEVMPIGSAAVPMMGVVQESFYDRAEGRSIESQRQQLQEFVLRYFLRVTHVGEASDTAVTRQVYYKRVDGRVGKFPKNERTPIVDLREIGRAYDWVILKADMLSFDLPFAPFGAGAPRFQLPIRESAHLVIAPAFVVNREQPEPGVVADYGFGYAFVPGLQSRFPTATQSVRFRLTADGEIRARAVTLINRPERIAAVDLDPIAWGVQLADLMTFRMASRVMSPVLAVTDRLPLRTHGVDPVAAYIWMANALTGGLAQKHLGISKVELEKRMLLQHFKQQHELLQRSLQVWRMVPDWTAPAPLPDYCQNGVAS